MLDSVLRVLGLLGRALALVRPPIKADVRYLSYQDHDRVSGGDVFYFTPHPQYYSAEIEFTNRSPHVEFIRRVTLILDGRQPLEWSESDPIRLEAREPKVYQIIFPALREENPLEEGGF